MYIKIRRTSFYYLLCGLALIYTLTFGYWDAKSLLQKYLFNGLMVFEILLYFLTVLKNKKTTMKKDTTILYAFSIIYFSFSALAFSDQRVIVNGLYSYVYYQLLIFAWIFALRKLNIVKLFPVFEVIGIISSLLGVYEVMSGSLLLGGKAFGKSFGGSYVVRAVVFSGSFLTLGMFLAIIIIIAFYMYQSQKRVRHLICMCICILGLFMTSSRGPMVATAVGLIVVYLFVDTASFKKRVQRVVSLIFIIVAVSFVFFLIANTVMKDNFYFSYLQMRLSSILDWTGESGNVGRVSRWNQFSQLFSQHWLFGTGIGSSGTRAAELIGALNTESGVLKRLLELGVIGFTIYYSMIISVLQYGIRYYRRNIEKKPVIVVAFAVVTSILVEECIMQITETIMVSVLFWLFMGYIVLTSQGNVAE